MVEVKITERARRFGYVFWTFRQDDEMAKLLGDRNAVDLVFMNASHGHKNVDRRYRRISIGARWTKPLPESKKVFVLKMLKPNTLEIQCR